MTNIEQHLYSLTHHLANRVTRGITNEVDPEDLLVEVRRETRDALRSVYSDGWSDGYGAAAQ